MVEQSVTFTIDGTDYAGVYEVLGHGESAAVSVRFEANTISAFAGHLRPDVVARTLLGELVRAKLLEDGSTRSPGRTARGTGAEPLHYRYSRPAPSAAAPPRHPTRLMPRAASGLAFSPPGVR